MSATHSSNASASRARAIDPDAEYFQAVQEYFVGRRGDPLLLSNADWLLIRKWRRLSVPLRIVLRGIRDVFDGHDHSWNRGRKIASLRYCAAGVEAARRHWHRALSFESKERARLTDFIDTRVKALESAAGLGKRSQALRDRIVAQLRRLGENPGETEALDAWLQKQEEALVAALGREESADERARIADEIERDLAPYLGRMPERVLDQVRGESLARRMLERHGLPRLSLFHAE